MLFKPICLSLKGRRLSCHVQFQERARNALPSLQPCCCLAAVTVARLFATYHVFTATYDEPAHIASGMEWLDKGAYTYEAEHPPLAPVAVALGPYLAGLRSRGLPDLFDEGNAILYSTADPWQISRWPVSAICHFLLWRAPLFSSGACRWYTVGTGFWAVLLFLSLPLFSVHAALATTIWPVRPHW